MLELLWTLELSSPWRSENGGGNKLSELTRCTDVCEKSWTYKDGSRCIGHRA